MAVAAISHFVADRCRYPLAVKDDAAIVLTSPPASPRVPTQVLVDPLTAVGFASSVADYSSRLLSSSPVSSGLSKVRYTYLTKSIGPKA